MAITITSTTSPQAELDHAVSEDWREPLVAEPEAPKPNEEAQSETAPTEESAEHREETPAPKPKGGWQKRIDKLTARNHALESELAELRTKAKPEEAKTDPNAPKEPKINEYKTVEEFLTARDAWKDAQELHELQLERGKQVEENYRKHVSEALGRYDDWNEVVSAAKDVVMPQLAVDAIKEANNGPDVAYYLATHPEEANTLVDLSPAAAVRMIDRISDKLAAETTRAAAPKPKPKAPEPITPVGGTATRSSVQLDELPIRDYIKVRNRQERENRGR